MFEQELASLIRTNFPMATVYIHSFPHIKDKAFFMICLIPVGEGYTTNRQRSEYHIKVVCSGTGETSLARVTSLYNFFCPIGFLAERSFSLTSYIINSIFPLERGRLINNESNIFFASIRLKFMVSERT